MRICANIEKPAPAPTVPIIGRLYQRNDQIYICAYENRLINLHTGSGWAGAAGFNNYSFTDVTDEYCLSKA